MAAAPEKTFTIGIDLGTTFSCVGVWRNGRVEIIANDQGNRTTPSVVSFRDGECMVGEAGEAQVITNAENTVYDAKRLIGRRFSDRRVQEDMRHWPFRIVEKDGMPNVEVRIEGRDKLFAPEEISSMVLEKLKRDAETYLNGKVTDAVITCPAYFDDSQRAATRNAGRLAGLNVVRIIDEPTAAALAYGLNRREGSSNVLIFDFGGGTLDVSLLHLEGGVFTVKAVAGDTHLGGEDITNRLVEHFANDFKTRTGKDILSDIKSSNGEVRANAKESLSVLRASCEKAKRLLSSATTADVFFQYGVSYRSSISRARLNEHCRDIFSRCMVPLTKVLEDSGVAKDQVNEIVLVGGSTRIPRIQEMVREFFGGRELRQTVNADEAVAIGAAIQASILTDAHEHDELHGVRLVLKTPHTLGIHTVGDWMAVVVPRNTPFPCTISRTGFTTDNDNQTTADFRVFEGESRKTTENHLLGKFLLTGIPPAPAMEPQFEVTFDIDADGIINVSARDEKTGNQTGIRISDQGRLSEEEVDRMIRNGGRR